MKKIFIPLMAIFFVCACDTTKEDVLPVDEQLMLPDYEALSRSTHPSYFYEALITYLAPYSKQYVPTTEAGNELLQIVFASAISNYLYEGNMGDADIYAPTYVSWYFAHYFNSGEEAHDVEYDEEEEEDALSTSAAEEIAPAYINPNEIRDGALYEAVMTSLIGVTNNNLFGISDALKPLYLSIAINNVTGILPQPAPDMSAIIEIMKRALAHRDSANPYQSLKPVAGYFSTYDGISYMMDTYPELTTPMDVIGMCLPAIMGAKNDATRQQIALGLANLFNNNPVLLQIMDEQTTERVIQALSVAGKAVNFWGEVECNRYFDFTQTVANVGIDYGTEITINSNAPWTATVQVPAGERAFLRVNTFHSEEGDDSGISLDCTSALYYKVGMYNNVVIRYTLCDGIERQHILKVMFTPVFGTAPRFSPSPIYVPRAGGGSSVNVTSNTYWRPYHASDFIGLDEEADDGELTGVWYRQGNGNISFYVGAYEYPAPPPGEDVADREGFIRIQYFNSSGSIATMDATLSQGSM